MKLTNYQRALVIIHKLEDQFGSITKVPESDPEMQEIHRLLPIGRQSEDIHYERACWLNREGYSITYIAQVTHHSQAAISKYFSTYNIDFEMLSPMLKVNTPVLQFVCHPCHLYDISY